jgi:Na+-translocating ferredoxin:NAD+ oxidoreductase RnfG subunit
MNRNAAAVIAGLVLVVVCKGCSEGDKAVVGGYGKKPVENRRLIRSDGDIKVYEVAASAEQAGGYVVEMTELGLSARFKMAVEVDPELTVREVRILSYTGDRGRGVLKKRFLSQYEGARAGKTGGVDRGIDSVTGSTISSAGVYNGVSRALQMLQSCCAEGM